MSGYPWRQQRLTGCVRIRPRHGSNGMVVERTSSGCRRVRPGVKHGPGRPAPMGPRCWRSSKRMMRHLYCAAWSLWKLCDRSGYRTFSSSTGPEGPHVDWRTNEQTPPSGRYIGSPYDPEARYATKGTTVWSGYKVHLTEKCDDGFPNLITNVETTNAAVSETR